MRPAKPEAARMMPMLLIVDFLPGAVETESSEVQAPTNPHRYPTRLAGAAE